MSLEPAALAALRASAEQGMSEDAAAAHGAARERLLQLYRDAWTDHGHLQLNDPEPRSQPMGEADLPGIEWLTRLAEAGHVPAADFLERALQGLHLRNLVAVAPRQMEALAPRIPRIARYFALHEAQKPVPDRGRLDAWLERVGFELRGLASALRELDDVAGGPCEADWAAVREVMAEQVPGGFEHVDFRSATHLLYRLGLARRAHPEEAKRASARPLLERAAALGSHQALEAIFAEGFEAAASKAAFLQQWFSAGWAATRSSRLPCLQLGAALERGAAGRAPDLDAALPWYERALDKRAAIEPGRLNNEFCYAVAVAFDRRFPSMCTVDDAELAVKWHERGLAVGDERCCDAWLEACAKGAMGLAADPAAAVDCAQRFRRSGANLKGCRWRIAGAVAAMHAAGAAEPDPARAARWRAAAAAIESD